MKYLYINIMWPQINKNMIDNFQDQNNNSAGQRFSNQFALLEKYEADYVELSGKLKPSSKTLINFEGRLIIFIW